MAEDNAPVEQRVLCACARRVAQTSAPLLPDVVTPIDWDVLVSTAVDHGVAELLFAPLSSGRFEVPVHVLSALERRVLEATGQGLRRTAELAQLVRLLDERGIRTLAFKGPVLAAAVYGHVGCRVSSDLDLFVDRRDFRQACAILLKAGYQQRLSRSDESDWLLAGNVPVEGRYVEFLPGYPSQSMVDLHTAFTTWRFGIRLEAPSLFERSSTVDVVGHQLPTLHPHDLLLVLALHGMSHQWKPLRLVSDIDAVAELVTDWSDVIERTEAAGLRRALWVALLLAEHLLGTVLPSEVRARATADAVAQSLAKGAAARMFAPSDAGIPDARGWARSFLDAPHRQLAFVVRGTITGWLTRRQRPSGRA